MISSLRVQASLFATLREGMYNYKDWYCSERRSRPELDPSPESSESSREG